MILNRHAKVRGEIVRDMDMCVCVLELLFIRYLIRSSPLRVADKAFGSGDEENRERNKKRNSQTKHIHGYLQID